MLSLIGCCSGFAFGLHLQTQHNLDTGFALLRWPTGQVGNRGPRICAALPHENLQFFYFTCNGFCIIRFCYQCRKTTVVEIRRISSVFLYEGKITGHMVDALRKLALGLIECVSRSSGEQVVAN